MSERQDRPRWWQRLVEGLGTCLHHLNGGAAYARYVEHLRLHHPEVTPPGADEFHRREQQRRWDGVRRCC